MLYLKISQKIRANNHGSKSEEGFSLVEVLVAIFVGSVVMMIAVATLGVTNSTSLRLIAKSEAQRGSRQAITTLFSEVSDAESPEICRVGVDKEVQDAIAATTYTGQPSSQVTPNSCKETSASGLVLVYAKENLFCFFKQAANSDLGVTTTPPYVKCVGRGDQVASTSEVRSPHQGINIKNCVDTGQNANASQLIVYRCDGATSGYSSIKWPPSYSAASGDAGKPSVVTELGENGSDALKPLFTYVKAIDPLSGCAAAYPTTETCLKNIIAINVVLPIYYSAHKGSEKKIYYYRATIMLRGSEAALQEYFNGYVL